MRENSVSTIPANNMSSAPVAMIFPFTWLDFSDTNGSVDKLPHKSATKCVDSMFGCTVDAASSVGLSAGDGAKVNNMTGLPFLKVYEAE